MSSNVADLRDTIVPKSDQLNAEQLLGGPITITVTEVRRGSGEEQPVVIHYEGEGGRPYKPCKSMRKVLVFAWGGDGREWAGRSMTIFNRPDVKFGGEEVGGIRISHLSHIDRDIAIALTATRGRKEQTRIKKLDEAETVGGSRSRLEAAARGGMENLRSAWAAIPKDHQRSIGGAKGCPSELKDIAVAADAKRGSGENTQAGDAPTAKDVHDAISNAADRDALEDAADLIRALPDADRPALIALYETRRDGFDLDEK
jgi:hypothetical protein